MNKRVADPTSSRPLPVYEVEEVLVERRLRKGAYLVEHNGVQVAMERRRASLAPEFLGRDGGTRAARRQAP